MTQPDDDNSVKNKPYSFDSPQGTIDPAHLHKTSIFLRRDDAIALERMHSRNGTLIRTFNVITQKLIPTLRAAGCDPNIYDPDLYERLICSAIITFPSNDTSLGCTTHVNGIATPQPLPPSSQAPDPHDPNGANRVPRPRKKAPAKRTDVG